MVLSVTTLHGAKAVKDYHREHYAKGDYPFGHRDVSMAVIPEVIVGRWSGKAAERLGLSGEVERKEMYAVIDKKHPKKEGVYLGSRKDKRGAKAKNGEEKEPIVGFDLTLNAPKSVTNQYMLTGDERILEAFLDAIRFVRPQLESDVWVRVRGKKNIAQAKEDAEKGLVEIRENSHGQLIKRVGNAVMAEFIHTTARPEPDKETGLIFPDAHLHAHYVMGNFAWDEGHINRDGSKGAWLAIDIETMKQRAGLREAAFHNRLAENLTEIGMEIERRGDGFFDLKGHTREMIDKSSRRSEAIKELAEELGYTGDKVKVGGLAREMRRHKSEAELSWTDILQQWHKMFTREEMNIITDIKHMSAVSTGPVGPTLGVYEVVNWATQLTLSRESTATMDKFRETAYRFGYGQVGVEAIDEEINRRLESGELFSAYAGDEHRVSSLPVYREEQYILDFVKQGVRQHSRMGPLEVQWKSDLFRDPRKDSWEQEQAASAILRSHNRVIGFRGPAGAGKTSLMQEVVGQLEEKGRKVFTLAPHGRGRGVLEREGFDAQTVRRFLVDKKASDRVSKGDVIWIDEAGLVGAVDMAQVMRLAEKKGARIVLSGDSKQHRPVPRGDVLAMLEERGEVRVAELKEIRRQTPNPEYLRVAQLIADGQVKAGFQALEVMGALKDVSGLERGGYLETFATDYVQAISGRNRDGKPTDVLALSPSNRERQEASDAIRVQLRKAGLLVGDDRDYETLKSTQQSEAELGDAATYRWHLRQERQVVVRFHQNTKSDMPARGKGRPFFNAGGMFDVEAVEDGRVMVRDARGTLAELPLSSSGNFTLFTKERTPVAIGERIKITQNFKLDRFVPGKRKRQNAVSNGDVLHVDRIEDNGDLVAGPLNEQGEVNLERAVVVPEDFGHMTHGYVVTSVGSQGDTVDEVMIAQTGPSLGRATSAEQFYVSVTRGKEDVRIYTDDRDRLLKRITESAQGISASELKDLADQQRGPDERKMRHKRQLREAATMTRQGKSEKDIRRQYGAVVAAEVMRGKKQPARGDRWVDRVK